jgi:hypothetical protein
VRRALPAGVARAIAATVVLASFAPSALAGEAQSFENGLSHADWSQHPGAAVGGMVAMVLGGLLAAAGVGCAVALVGAVVPRLRDGVEASARGASAGRLWLVGCLALGGVLLALGALAKIGVATVSAVAAIALGVPTLALLLVGALGAIPLLGERLLGDAGAAASPLRRSVTASVALGLGLLPAFVPILVPLGFLVGLVALAWPLGVGIQAASRLFVRRS